jgi:hypothetical protein
MMIWIATGREMGNGSAGILVRYKRSMQRYEPVFDWYVGL